MDFYMKKRLDAAIDECAKNYDKQRMIQALRDGKLSSDDILGLNEGIVAAYYETNKQGGQDVMIFAPALRLQPQHQ